MENINGKWLKRLGICPMGDIVATPNRLDEFLLEKVRRELQSIHHQKGTPLRVQPQEYSPASIRQMIYQGHFFQPGISEELNDENLKGKNSWESEPIINLVDTLLDQAFQQKATDIHIEPNDNELRIRFRKDGLLEDYRSLPLWVADPILVRLKIISNIDITDKRIPHDGSFSYSDIQVNANIRVSTLPVKGGEKCVLRLLPQKTEINEFSGGLQSLHFSKKINVHLQNIFNSPQGLFLVTGPTGSGKTTTLHHGLQEIIQKKINVVTIEDPIEYTLKGANQVQVNEKCGINFATALRSILRQDPDVILIGEIRDPETAQIAIRAAQTGHLVLSTLHTNSAAATFTRLHDLGIQQNLLKESLLGIMAQRLVRKKNGGRRAIVELMCPDGSYVDGSIQESARRLVQQGVITQDELHRVLGNLCYIEPHEDF